MPPPPKRRGGGRGGRGGKRPGSAPYTVPAAPVPSERRAAKEQSLADSPAHSAVPTPVATDGQRPFAEMEGVLDQGLLKGVDAMGFKYMSPVQEKVLTELPSLSSDCLVQAKTGTGKTAAFLLPAIQNLLAGNMPPRGGVGILVICPTRELALQIAKECQDIMAHLPVRMECHTAFGGTQRASSLKRFITGKPTVLVATPGRLDDILGEEEVREKLSNLKTLVLDEADRMLDQGFAPAIHKILKRLPPKSDGWQGMCFSATLPERVNDVVKCVLFPGYTYLSTIDPNEAPTVARVPQFSVTVPSIKQTFATLIAVLDKEYNDKPDDFKVVVFGTTANGVGMLYDLCKLALPQFKTFELHSRMSQNARTRTTNEFKEAPRGILIASDVVGRGMDFPNVSLVIQLGLPMNTEQYIHRVGRTARAGRDGRAIMILFSNESFFTATNPSLPIKPYPVDIVAELPKYQPLVDKSFPNVDETAKAKAYQAFLGYNKTYLKKLRLQPKELVQIANEYAAAMGCPEPPMIEKKVVGKMGLKGVPGLRIGSRDTYKA
ncbi:hypothetical protein N0V90_001670 [Kalmusia sp. IMI 367209]|nr:hypothetical protein N0V90_001670 [Kalmusia sp. IMI 367209]